MSTLLDAENSKESVESGVLVGVVKMLSAAELGRGVNSQEAVVMGRHTFRNTDDVKAWVKEHIGHDLSSFNFGVFYDPMAILHHVFLKLTNNNSDLKEIHLRSQLKMTIG